LKLFTFLPMETIDELSRLEGAAINQAKRELAFEVTKIVHSESEAKAAQDAAEAAFKGKGDADAVPTTAMAKNTLKAGLPAWQMFVETGLCKTNSEARRLIKQGGGYVGEERISDFNNAITLDMAGEDGAIWLRAGKKKHHRVVPE
jgi:tyrosyl-tRNA synthetase